MKPTWRRLLFLLVVMTGLLAAGCGGDDEEGEASGDTGAATAASTSGSAAAKPAIVLGTKNFTEQYVLGELYRQALEAKGYDVTLKSDIGSTEIIDAALTSGEINVYPEYTGTVAHRRLRRAGLEGDGRGDLRRGEVEVRGAGARRSTT